MVLKQIRTDYCFSNLEQQTISQYSKKRHKSLTKLSQYAVVQNKQSPKKPQDMSYKRNLYFSIHKIKILLKPLTPVPTMQNRPWRAFGLCSTSDVITFAQIRYRKYLSSVEGKDTTNDTQSRVIGLIEHDVRTKVLRNE